MTTTSQYSIVIEWSPEDQAYLVSLPEWADRYAMPVTSGATYEEAAARGRCAASARPGRRVRGTGGTSIIGEIPKGAGGEGAPAAAATEALPTMCQSILLARRASAAQTARHGGRSSRNCSPTRAIRASVLYRGPALRQSGRVHP